jgi:hypothetical protein
MLRTNITIHVAAMLYQDGVTLYCNDEAEDITFFQLVNEFIDGHCVPSIPPTIRQEGREAISLLAYRFEALAAYMRKQADEITEWESPNSLGHRD